MPPKKTMVLGAAL
jgi:hypothetical protein